jgi:hypothetical protein
MISRRALPCACLLLMAFAGPSSSTAAPNYLEPRVLTGTIRDLVSRKTLFTFRRTATNDGAGIVVSREFLLPTGVVIAREKVRYQNGNLAQVSLDDFQNQSHGSAEVSNPGRDRPAEITFEYVVGKSRKTGREKLAKDTLTADMVGPFIAEHWAELNSGTTIRCRVIAMSRAETVGFKLFKVSDAPDQNSAVVIRMEPSSFLIARLVNPLDFVVEKGGAHRIRQYTGRTTPTLKRNGKWEEFDALTVLDWK